LPSVEVESMHFQSIKKEVEIIKSTEQKKNHYLQDNQKKPSKHAGFFLRIQRKAQ